MKPPPFQYYDPDTLDEALHLNATLKNAKLLAGGQSLMPMLNNRHVLPDHLIDINRIAELGGIEEKDGTLSIGAMTRQRDLEFSPIIARRCPLMREALGQVGHRQTRNRGTIGGSLCHLDPVAELVAVATAHDATIQVRSRHGVREIAMAEFAVGSMSPALQAGEILTSLRFTPWCDGHGSAFIEFSRRSGSFAIVAAAVLVELSDELFVARTAIVVSGLTFKPERMREAECLLTSKSPTKALIEQAAATCGAIATTSNVHASAGYRQHLARLLAYRAISIATQRAHANRRGTAI